MASEASGWASEGADPDLLRLECFYLGRVYGMQFARSATYGQLRKKISELSGIPENKMVISNLTTDGTLPPLGTHLKDMSLRARFNLDVLTDVQRIATLASAADGVQRSFEDLCEQTSLAGGADGGTDGERDGGAEASGEHGSVTREEAVDDAPLDYDLHRKRHLVLAESLMKMLGELDSIRGDDEIRALRKAQVVRINRLLDAIEKEAERLRHKL